MTESRFTIAWHKAGDDTDLPAASRRIYPRIAHFSRTTMEIAMKVKTNVRAGRGANSNSNSKSKSSADDSATVYVRPVSRCAGV